MSRNKRRAIAPAGAQADGAGTGEYLIVGSFIGYMISGCAKENIFRDHDSARILLAGALEDEHSTTLGER